MFRTFIATLATVSAATLGHAQDATPPSNPASAPTTPPPANGVLLTGQLTPGLAIGAAALGLFATVAADGSTGTTTTTTTRQ